MRLGWLPLVIGLAWTGPVQTELTLPWRIALEAGSDVGSGL